jgi:hypothetical protein
MQVKNEIEGLAIYNGGKLLGFIDRSGNEFFPSVGMLTGAELAFIAQVIASFEIWDLSTKTVDPSKTF